MALSKQMEHTKQSNFNLNSAPIRFVATVLAAIITLAFFWWSVELTKDKDANPFLLAGVAMFVGVFGIWAIFWVMDSFVSLIPNEKIRSRILPYIFIGPAISLLFVYSIRPAVLTIINSFKDARLENYVGFANYSFLFTDDKMITAFQNNINWLVFATSGSVILGLLIAVLADKVRYEAVAKSFIFIPMAISLVGASVIWRFVYAYIPANRPQIGLLNAILVSMGGEPTAFLIEKGMNNFALMAIMVWLQAGFAMVLLSAAIKGVPSELIDAAKIDGANAWQIFWSVVIPYIRGTIIAVTTMIAVSVLKVFDIVFVMTSGQFDTEVLANRMFAEMFKFQNFGRGSTLAVVLFLAVIPIIVMNIRNFRDQRS